MAELTYLVSALVTGLLLVATATALGRNRRWRRYSPASAGGRSPTGRSAGGSVAWILGFLAVAVALGAGAVLSADGTGDAGTLGNGAGSVLALLFLAVLGVYLFWGVYHSARFRGLKSAQAAALSAWVFALLLVVAIVLKLVTAG